MSFFGEQVRAFGARVSAFIPFGKQKEQQEYFFALNLSFEKLTAALWTIEGKELKILQVAEKEYSKTEQITEVTDSLLDSVLGIRQIEPQKILFGVPNNWLADDNLKEEYLNLLRGLVKDLELTPMAYVATNHAINHFFEKQDGIPQTAILVGFEKKHLSVTVTRAGKIDGVRILERGENSGADIEKALLAFTDIETLPAKILLYGLEEEELENLKSQLLSFPWMSKLSFLHFPKIEILSQNLEIKTICLAGATELQSDVVFHDKPIQKLRSSIVGSLEEEIENLDEVKEEKVFKGDNFGFVVGDVSTKLQTSSSSEVDDFDKREDLPTELASMPVVDQFKLTSFLNKFKSAGKRLFYSKNNYMLQTILLGLIGTTIVLIGAYMLLVRVQVKVFVEPKILERDTQVIADPKQKEVLEEAKIIPGQLVETEVSGTEKEAATGTRQIGDPAKGTVILYNKTDDRVNISKGTVLSGPGNTKFTLDVAVSIASQEARADGISFGKQTTTVTAQSVGADGNIPSNSDLSVAGYSSSQVSAKSEGNFAGGTSKEVTVVSSDDQKRLLASLASSLRKQAQQKLQEQFPDKKILEEALSEQILSRNYNKNVNDQAEEFSLNMTIRFRGTAFDEKDLKRIVGKLVTTDVPEGYELNLQDTETQSDVAKLESDGRLIFLARFRAKLMPKFDTNALKNQIKGKTVQEAAEKLKALENVLGSEFKMTPSLPSFIQRLPILPQNIEIEVGLK